MDINQFLKEPLIEKIYNDRSESFYYYFLKNSKNTKKKRNNIENKLRQLLNFVENEHYKYVNNEIDDILWEIQGYAEHLNKAHYKLGLINGMNLDKETKQELEEIFNEQNEESNE